MKAKIKLLILMFLFLNIKNVYADEYTDVLGCDDNSVIREVQGKNACVNINPVDDNSTSEQIELEKPEAICPDSYYGVTGGIFIEERNYLYTSCFRKAKPLVCIYKGSSQQYATMYYQTSTGERGVKSLNTFYHDQNDMYDEGWEDLGTSYKNNNSRTVLIYSFNTKYYDKVKGLTDCPGYTRNEMGSVYNKPCHPGGGGRTEDSNCRYNTYYFYDDKTWHLDYALLKKYEINLGHESEALTFTSHDYSKTENTEWLMVCKDNEDVDLFFNRDKYILIIKSSQVTSARANFSLNDLLTYYDKYNNCPRLVGDIIYSGTYGLYSFMNMEYSLGLNATGYVFPDDVPEIIVHDCNSLLGSPDDPSAPAYYLTFAFNVIKYIAIILLIALTIVDFMSAIASQNDDELKKATGKAIKRLLLCILIFLLPIIIKVILKLLNDRAIDLCLKTM